MPFPSAILLDRDGTLIVDRHYLCDPAQVELLPNAVAGLRSLARWNCPLIVVTNQSGIGRGLFTTEQLMAVHDRLVALLAAEGIRLAGMYFCPHTPAEACNCRKPASGLVVQAVRDWRFVPELSVMIGDKACDVELGHAIGARAIMVRTGAGRQQEPEPAVRPHAVVDDLLAAAQWIEAEFLREN